jgi:murein DD-endopeptidase MepM/ murein hydrolase activator NlpD
MGSTGFSTGPHSHFEVHPSGKGAVNPIAFLPNRI